MSAENIRAGNIEASVLEKRFPGLARELNAGALPELAQAWASLKPMTKLAAFKLLSPDHAVGLYELLPFEEQYFLFSGFSPASIAPLIEPLAPAARKAFTELPRRHYDRMLDLLLRPKYPESAGFGRPEQKDSGSSGRRTGPASSGVPDAESRA
ncbi:MAG TPA: hypothetical protein VNK24_07650 [Elusimicrobiota bacterium]|nr:hypothetical protein [Elusimicrobiota bacterium]